MDWSTFLSFNRRFVTAGKELEEPPISEAGQNGNSQSAEQFAVGNPSQGGYPGGIDTDSGGFHRHAKVRLDLPPSVRTWLTHIAYCLQRSVGSQTTARRTG